jgi:hypothetical protein
MQYHGQYHDLLSYALCVPLVLVACGLWGCARRLRQIALELRGQNNLTQIFMGRQQETLQRWRSQRNYSS